MTTQWKVQIDWDRDGLFDETYDDITERVIHTKWFLGFTNPYEDVAVNPRLELKLDNSDRLFSPENSSSPLSGKIKPHVPIRVVTNDGGTERIMWMGWLSGLAPSVSKYGEQVMNIVAQGAASFYRATETKIGLQENKRTDEIIKRLIAEVVYPPNMAGVFILGVPGHMELGVNTRLGDSSGLSRLEPGTLTLGYAGDNWGGVHTLLKIELCTPRSRFINDP